jgi:tetratricopeptide (TPR) repeat protein
VVLAGGVTLAVFVIRGGTPAPASAASGSAKRPDPGQDIIARANELFAHGDKDAALELINRSRRQAPDSAGLPYTAGRIYFAKFYWNDGLKSFREAIRSDPSYRDDPELIKTVLRGFLTTPSYNDEIASFLHDDIGRAVQPMLEETVRDHPSAVVRSRAANELRRYH